LCECGYQTMQRSNWCIHKKSCKLVESSDKVRITSLERELAEKEEIINEQRQDIKMFEKLLAERFVELQEEVKQLRKRKVPRRRIHRSEPERRKIAQRQNWKCASETCELVGELDAYDLDHITPLWKGGEDKDYNLQALCPACHRIKTDLERLEMVREI